MVRNYKNLEFDNQTLISLIVNRTEKSSGELKGKENDKDFIYTTKQNQTEKKECEIDYENLLFSG